MERFKKMSKLLITLNLLALAASGGAIGVSAMSLIKANSLTVQGTKGPQGDKGPNGPEGPQE